MMSETAAAREPAASAAGGARIVGRAVGKQFTAKDKAFVALDNVSFEISGGEFVSLIGPSGCGKSTLMLITAGLIPASSGEILVAGKPMLRPLTDVGIVFQDHLLLDFRTALANVMLQAEVRGLPPAPMREEALRLLAKLGIPDIACDRYPNQLSGGMRQRVSIARALIHQPSVLLMDEPFGALDALTREQMRLDLEALWMATRKTVLFITHSIDEAVLLADRVVVMSPRPGKIECVMDIALSRPRGLEARRAPAFVEATERITEIFLARGVLHGAGATPIEGDSST
jgi:NitT/TauT family transport system ATP-binding protein